MNQSKKSETRALADHAGPLEQSKQFLTESALPVDRKTKQEFQLKISLPAVDSAVVMDVMEVTLEEHGTTIRTVELFPDGSMVTRQDAKPTHSLHVIITPQENTDLADPLNLLLSVRNNVTMELTGVMINTKDIQSTVFPLKLLKSKLKS